MDSDPNRLHKAARSGGAAHPLKLLQRFAQGTFGLTCVCRTRCRGGSRTVKPARCLFLSGWYGRRRCCAEAVRGRCRDGLVLAGEYHHRFNLMAVLFIVVDADEFARCRQSALHGEQRAVIVITGAVAIIHWLRIMLRRIRFAGFRQALFKRQRQASEIIGLIVIVMLVYGERAQGGRNNSGSIHPGLAKQRGWHWRGGIRRRRWCRGGVGGWGSIRRRRWCGGCGGGCGGSECWRCSCGRGR